MTEQEQAAQDMRREVKGLCRLCGGPVARYLRHLPHVRLCSLCAYGPDKAFERLGTVTGELVKALVRKLPGWRKL